MKTSTLRLGLSLLAALGFGLDRLSAQDAGQPMQPVMVVPAMSYAPAHPVNGATAETFSSMIKPAGYQVPAETPVDAPPVGPPLDFNGADAPAIPRIWTRADYLLWWLKQAPLPVPIVTTGNPNIGVNAAGVVVTNTAGAIGQPGTQILLGDQTLDFGPFSGMHFAVGGWIDDERTIGVEVSAFMLECRSYNFSVASDPTGNNPPLYFPRFNPSVGFEDAVPIADPLRGFSGGVSAYSSMQLWGAEANVTWNLVRRPGFEFTVLGGFRNANLNESFLINNTTTDLASGNITTLNDSFGTANHFYGGQVGAQFVLERYGFSLDITGKLAMGTTSQVVDIEGATTQFGPNPLIPPGLGTSVGGFFAEPSNIGRRSADTFSVIPSFELNLSYQITQEWRVFIGYSFMFWSQVVRPGDQIDHSVNTSQNAILTPSLTGSTSLIGPPTPLPLFNRTDFWAQGLNFGMEFRF